MAISPRGIIGSVRVLGAMAADHASSHIQFVRARSAAIKRQLLDLPWTGTQDARYRELAQASVRAQREAEVRDGGVPFEEFRRVYVDPARLYPERRREHAAG